MSDKLIFDFGANFQRVLYDREYYFIVIGWEQEN